MSFFAFCMLFINNVQYVFLNCAGYGWKLTQSCQHPSKTMAGTGAPVEQEVLLQCRQLLQYSAFHLPWEPCCTLKQYILDLK